MGLISIDDIQDGTNAKGNDINSRLAKLVGLVNGNIEAANLAAGSVGTAKIVDKSVTSAKMAPTKYQDANGWTVYDYGSWKQYSKAFPFANVSVQTGQRTTISNGLKLPANIAQQSSLFFTMAYIGSFSGHAVFGIDSAGSNTNEFGLNLGNEYNGGTLSFSGNIHITAVDV